jgi:hypothetical protein
MTMLPRTDVPVKRLRVIPAGARIVDKSPSAHAVGAVEADALVRPTSHAKDGDATTGFTPFVRRSDAALEDVRRGKKPRGQRPAEANDVGRRDFRNGRGG